MCLPDRVSYLVFVVLFIVFGGYTSGCLRTVLLHWEPVVPCRIPLAHTTPKPHLQEYMRVRVGLMLRVRPGEMHRWPRLNLSERMRPSSSDRPQHPTLRLPIRVRALGSGSVGHRHESPAGQSLVIPVLHHTLLFHPPSSLGLGERGSGLGSSLGFQHLGSQWRNTPHGGDQRLVLKQFRMPLPPRLPQVLDRERKVRQTL